MLAKRLEQLRRVGRLRETRRARQHEPAPLLWLLALPVVGDAAEQARRALDPANRRLHGQQEELQPATGLAVADAAEDQQLAERLRVLLGPHDQLLSSDRLELQPLGHHPARGAEGLRGRLREVGGLIGDDRLMDRWGCMSAWAVGLMATRVANEGVYAHTGNGPRLVMRRRAALGIDEP